MGIETLTPERIAEICADHLPTLEANEVMSTMLQHPDRIAVLLSAGKPRFKSEADVARWVLQACRRAHEGTQ